MRVDPTGSKLVSKRPRVNLGCVPEQVHLNRGSAMNKKLGVSNR